VETVAHPSRTATAAAAGSPVRVLLVDDQALFRSGLARLLAADPRVEVVGEAVDGLDAVDRCAATAPDVVLMDLRMPTCDGVEATRRILRASRGSRVLILSAFDADCHVLGALRAGASGYVLKDSTPEGIVCSILATHMGERVMAGTVADRVLGMLDGSAPPKELYDGLTAREMEILRLIAAGAPNKQIAFRLRISEKTVRNHVSNMYEKLSIFDRSQAVLYAVRKGLVEL
jgi:DNA-binding NarL/FixJ family response regulator